MIQRVNGSLAVSRALGDYDYKCVDGKGPTEQLVSPEPEVCEILRAEEDEFIILACDGIWDVMSNEELCEFVKSRLEVSDDLETVCNWVVDTCLHKVCNCFLQTAVLKLSSGLMGIVLTAVLGLLFPFSNFLSSKFCTHLTVYPC